MVVDAIPVRLAKMMVSRPLAVRSQCLVAAILEGVGIGLSTAGPFLLKWLVDAVAGHRVPIPELVLLVAGFVVAWSGSTLISTIRSVYSGHVIDALTTALTLAALRGSLPATTVSKDGDSGRILGLIERLPFSLQIVVDGLVWRAFPLVLQIVISLALVSYLIPLCYAIILAAVFVGFVLATWLGAIWYREPARRANQASSDVSQLIGDILRNARRVVFNGALDLELDAIGVKYRVKAQAGRSVWWSLVQFSGLQYLIIGVGLLILLTMGAIDVGAGRMTVGDFVLLQAYAFRLALPLSSFGFTLSQAGVAIGNIRDVFALQPGDAEPGDSPIIGGAAEVELRDVSFSYGPLLPGLREVSARFRPGSFNVIVGANGSGKSTLAQVIAGILEPASGEIFLGGNRMAAVDRSLRHRLILYVPQFIGLLNRSLRDNALYPPTSITEADAADLLREWQFHEGAHTLDLDAEVGEMAERLSGGQIQKLELARLAGVQVPVIILDESTSALDPKSETRVIKSLRQVFEGKTTLVLVTHRRSTAELANQVVLMQGGRLLAAGTHEELMAGCMEYHQLWDGELSES